MRIMVSFLLLAIAPHLWAHCDSTKGPVVAAAQLALAKGDVAPVLKWIRPNDEQEVRSAFAQAIAVRSVGGDAKALADRWFFETVVRLHRASEGEPFTGLKEETPEEHIALADAAIESGTIDPLEKVLLTSLRDRFNEVRAARAQANDSVEAGRRYVHAYTELMHWVEQMSERQ